MSDPAGPDPTVADLLRTLQVAGLALISGPTGARRSVTRPVVFDAWSPLPDLAGGLLLGVGLHPARPETLDVVRAAADHGFAAVVVKARGAEAGQLADLAATADAAGIAVLVIDDAVEWRQLDTLLTAAVGSAGHTEPSLSNLAVGDLFALANAVAAMVGGATAIEDPQQRVLAYSTLPGQPVDEDRRQGILGRQVPDLPVNAEQYRTLFRARTVCRFPATAPALPRLAVAVRAGAELLGSIWVVDAGGRLGGDAGRSLMAAADIAALHLLRARSQEDLARRERGELLRQLLEHRGDADLLARRLALPPAGPFVVLAFGPQAVEPDELATTRVLDLVGVHCEARQGRASCVAVAGTVYALLAGFSPGGRGLRTLAGEVVDRAARSLRLALHAAVGREVDRVEDVPTSRRDADLLLRLLGSRPVLGPVAAAAERPGSLAVEALAQLLTEDPRLVSSRVTALVDHDRRRGTSYAPTLQTYLECRQDVAEAASRLSVHPNTLRYRLRRVQALAGLDLGEPDEVLAAWLALRALAARPGSAARAVSGPPSPRPAGTP